jgi:hypothetical protein
MTDILFDVFFGFKFGFGFFLSFWFYIYLKRKYFYVKLWIEYDLPIFFKRVTGVFKKLTGGSK